MPNQMIFKRYELKYMLTRAQQKRLLAVMQSHMRQDIFAHAQIRNIYYDTDSFLLARRSIEKPVYKEKLRVRSYSLPAPDTKIFVELKKKSESIVYKRRIELPYQTLCTSPIHSLPSSGNTQIDREIQYFCSHYDGVHPVMFLSYERDAYVSLDDSDFRVTFDNHITARCDALSLNSPIYGTELLPHDCVLMELKTSGGIPLWMSAFLSDERIYRTSFSKYGTAYEHLVVTQTKGEQKYA